MRPYLVKRLILDLFYPNRCPFCDSFIPFDEYYCTSCGSKLSPPPENDEYENISFFTAVTEYNDRSKPIISEMKNESNGYALSAAAFMIFQSLLSEQLLSRIDIITYIPMRKRDILRRGYNQTKLIAKELGKLTDKPCRPLLKKTRDTSQQKTLGARERRENMKGAFSPCKVKTFAGKSVLIIDDVCTTGSTLNEAANVLLNSGAASVGASVFAKTAKIA